MSSDALQISNFHDSFHNRLSTRVLKDLKKTTSDTFKTAEVYYKERRSITSESTTLDTEHLFSINNSYSMVSHFWLEITSDNSAAFDIGDWSAANCIKRIEIEIGSRKLCDYTGDDLVKILWLTNRDTSVREELYQLANGITRPSGDPNAIPLLIPIIAPGSNCIYSLDASDQRTPAFPIGACNNPLVIRVTIQSGSYISKTNDFVMASLKLKFMSYAVKRDPIPNTRPSAVQGIYYTWNYVKPMSNTYTRTLSNATEDQFTIDNVITQGMLNMVIVDVLDRSTHVADKEYQWGQPIDELKLTVRGNSELYQHESQSEGRLLCLMDHKVPNKLRVRYNSGLSTGAIDSGAHSNAHTHALSTLDGYVQYQEQFGFIYPMSLTGRPDLSWVDVGSQGLNLNLNKPTIYLTCTSLTNTASQHTVRVLAIYKGLWNVLNDKSARLEIHP